MSGIQITFDEGFSLNLNVRLILPPVRAVIRLGGSNMPGTITIDEQNENATLGFVDRLGEDTTAPAGAQVSWTVDNTSIATLDVAADTLSAHVNPVAAGTCLVTAAIGGVTEADGSAFPDAQASLEVDPGAAVGARVQLSV